MDIQTLLLQVQITVIPHKITYHIANYLSFMALSLRDNAIEVYIERCEENVSAKLEEYLNGELKSVKKELQKLRMILAVIKMGKILSNTWFDGLNLTDTGDYTFSKDNETMIIKLDRKKVYF